MAAGRLDDDEKATLDNIEGAKINGLTKGAALPTLRKTGTYTVPTALPAPELPTIDLTDSALVLAIITAQATKAIEEGKHGVADTRKCRRLD